MVGVVGAVVSRPERNIRRRVCRSEAAGHGATASLWTGEGPRLLREGGWTERQITK